MNILVTGGAGFIGTHLCGDLARRGHKLTVVDCIDDQAHRESLNTVRDLPCALFWQGCAGDWQGDSHLTYDAVIHLAAKVGVGQSAYEQAEYAFCNTLDTAKLLERLDDRIKAGQRPKVLVVASSMSVYGESPAGFDGTNTMTRGPVGCREDFERPSPRSVYALTKYDQERLFLFFGQRHDIPTYALRLFNVYGPGQSLANPYTGAIANFATRILNGRPPLVYGDGNQTRDFVYVADVADAFRHFAECGAEGSGPSSGVYNVGTGRRWRIELVATALARLLGRPDLLPTIDGRRRVGDVQHCFASAKKTAEVAGWAARVDFMAGLERYAEWLLTQPKPEDRSDQAVAELEANGLLVTP